MTASVVEDPDAYLGLDGCEDSPNSDYVNLDDGVLSIDLTSKNENVIGDGVNAEAITEIRNVFQICNQGTQDVCVWIEFDPVQVNESDAVKIYRETAEGSIHQISGQEGAFTLGVGDCYCFSLLIDTRGIEVNEFENLMNGVTEDGDELVITAAAEDSHLYENPPCFQPDEPVLPECPFYGTSRSDPTAIFRIQYDPDSETIDEQRIGDDISDGSGDSNYPNGLAFDSDNAVWYFAEKGGFLKTMNEDGNLGIEDYEEIADGNDIAGAAFWDDGEGGDGEDEGEYLYIPNGGDTLKAAYISGDEVETRTVTDLNWSDIGLGDLAIDRDTQTLYVSTTRTNDGPNFFSVDLNDTDEQESIVEASADSTEFATGKQIAFAEGTLWAHEAEGGDWWTVNVDDGSLSDVVATTREYTDLARCGFAERRSEEIVESEGN